jgi:acyl carrier protein
MKAITHVDKAGFHSNFTKTLFTLIFKVVILAHMLKRAFGGMYMFEEIKKVLVDAINVDEALITPGAKLKEDLGIDSLSAVELALELESAFDVRIEDAELVKLITVQDIVDTVSAKKAA